MKNYLSLIIIVFVASLSFIACDEDDQMIATLNIEGIVFDQESERSIEGAVVELIGEGNKSVVTDANGYFSLGSYNTGSYIIKCTKDNYVAYSNKLTALNYEMQIAQEQNISLSIQMNEMTESISTLVLFRPIGDALPLPIAGVPFTIELGLFNEPIEGTTDQNGLVIVENLPKYHPISLVFNFEQNGTIYSSSSNFIISSQDNFPKIITITGEVDKMPLVITGTNLVDEVGYKVEDFDPSQPIILEFSCPVDTTQIDNNDIRIGNLWSSELKSAVWSSDNQKVALVFDGLDYGSDYYLSINLQSESYFTSYLNTNIYFSTKSEL